MATNIIKKRTEDTIVVFDLDKTKVEDLSSIGAEAADSIEMIGKTCDLIISMVPKSEHVRAVYKKFLPVLKEGQICMDMSTIDPSTSIELSKEVAKTGAVMIEAPVVKSQPAAVAGTLGIYTGGDHSACEKVKDILSCMGNNIIHMGDSGSGLVMKICHNTLVAEIQNGVNEMITLAQNKGINVDDFMTAISYGGGQNFYLDGKGPAIRDENWATAFSVENMNKDVNIAADLAVESELTLPGVSLVKDVYARAMDKDFGKEDFCATYKVVGN